MSKSHTAGVGVVFAGKKGGAGRRIGRFNARRGKRFGGGLCVKRLALGLGWRLALSTVFCYRASEFMGRKTDLLSQACAVFAIPAAFLFAGILMASAAL